MTHEQFAKLPFTQQCLLIKHLAAEVGKRQDTVHRYFLYQLDSFYIEIKLGLYDDKIEELISFSENKNLSNYLEKIDISGILH